MPVRAKRHAAHTNGMAGEGGADGLARAVSHNRTAPALPPVADGAVGADCDAAQLRRPKVGLWWFDDLESVLICTTALYSPSWSARFERAWAASSCLHACT